MLKKAIGLVLIYFFFACGQQAHAEPVKVLLKWYHQFQFAGHYAAIKKGFYSQEGIEVELFEGGQEIEGETIPLLLGGEYDFSVASLSILDAIYQRQPIVVLAQIFQQNSLAFISNRAKGIGDFKEIKGKKVTINREAGDSVFAFLDRMGVTREDITLVEILDPVHAILTDATDVFFSYSSTFPNLLMNNGIVPQEIRPEDYGWNFIGDTLITRKDIVEKRPDIVKKFISATLRGWDYALTHQEEIINYIMTLKTKRPFRISYEMLRSEAKATEKIISNDLMPLGHLHIDRWRDQLNRLCLYKGESCLGRDIEEYFFQDRRDYEKYFHISTWMLLLLLTFIFIAFSFVFQLKRIVSKRTRQMLDEVQLRRKTEHELKMHDYAVSLALEGGGVAFFDVKAPFHHMKTNEQFALQLGFSSENYHETVEHWISNIHPEDRDHFSLLFHNMIHGKGSSFDCETRFAHASGHWKWLLCRGKVVEWDGNKKPTRLLGIMLDIHEMKNAIEKASHTGKKHCALFSSMGHEIRTPLNCMMGFAELLVDESNLEKRQKHVAQITQNGQQLLRVISGLVDIARSEFEGAKIYKNTFAPQKTIDNLTGQLNKKMSSLDIHLVFDVAKGLPPQIKGEEQILTHIIHHLCDHFIKSMSEGSLRLTCRYINHSMRKGHLQFSFCTEGHEIRSDDILQLFNGQWNSLDDWSSFSGRDFALVVSKKLMDIVGGSFSLSTSDDGGRVFDVLFPVAEDDREELIDNEIVSDLSQCCAGSCRILIVDDDDSSAMLSKTIIEKGGAQVDCAREGLQAVKMLQKKSYDLIIMDIQMLGLDGIETTKIIRSRGINTPIIALSAHLVEQFEKNAQDAGINAFLQKPISAADLVAAVSRNCCKNREDR